MALIKCPECGHDISARAMFCRNCGAPISGFYVRKRAKVHIYGDLSNTVFSKGILIIDNTAVAPIRDRINTTVALSPGKHVIKVSDDSRYLTHYSNGESFVVPEDVRIMSVTLIAYHRKSIWIKYIRPIE